MSQTLYPSATKITDGTDVADIVTFGVQVTSSDKGLCTNSVIHGLSTAGGGSFVDVKVNPSGALATATTINDGTDTALVTAAGELNVLATAQPGVDIGDVTINNSSGASSVNIQDGGNSITVDAPVATPVFVRLSDGASAIATLPVSLASVPSHAVTNAGTFAVQDTTTRPATGTNTSVADNAASTTILASNANRRGATVTNDSSATLYLLLGSTAASTTNYTARIVQYGYYEVPFGYTGQLTGIWASDPNDGAARVTEITA
jgi:hypothetical protein